VRTQAIIFGIALLVISAYMTYAYLRRRMRR